jgi:hypothetical protein
VFTPTTIARVRRCRQRALRLDPKSDGGAYFCAGGTMKGTTCSRPSKPLRYCAAA